MVCVRHNPSAALRAAPPLTQGRLRSAPPVVRMNFHTAGASTRRIVEIRFPQRADIEIRPYGVCANIADNPIP